MINIKILTWSDLENTFQDKLFKSFKEYLTECNEINIQPNTCNFHSFKWLYLYSDTDLVNDIIGYLDYSSDMIFKEEFIHIVLFPSILDQENVKKKIESILNLKVFW